MVLRNAYKAKQKEAQDRGDSARRLSLLYAYGIPTGAPVPRKEKRRKSRRQRAQEYTAQYLQYIASDAWRIFRAKIFSQRGHKCERCQRIDGIMHLHHLTYKNLGFEEPQDVKILCKDCHYKAHHRG